MRVPRSARSLGAGLAVLLAAAAAAAPERAPPGEAAHALTVSDAWVRAIPGATVAAAYLKLHNGGTQPLRVTGVRSPLAAHAMIHQTQLVGGIATMRAREVLTIAPGASVMLAPGGLHVMLHDLAHPLAVGEQVPLELLLEGGGHVEVHARVRPPGAE